jgi:SAM-dependent methyltransferase
VLPLQPEAAGGHSPANVSAATRTAWTEHWSADKQLSATQRFFSVYRKAVFAPAIAHYVNRYLARSGVLVEAGCGTSETSIYIDKRGGARRLVAVDLVVPVLARCAAVMDARVGGDAFQLPFQTGSVDAIWNVGVMEHFTAPAIDAMLREFHRVLKPGGRLLLFWPGVTSVPQRVLRVLQFLVRLRPSCAGFRFHPDEISQLRSLSDGRAILARNGFIPLRSDHGVRTLLAFKVLVGAKRSLS